MRSLVSTLALGVAALAMLGAAPSEANAQWPVVVNGYRVGPYGTLNAYGLPAWRAYASPWGFGRAVYWPGAYQTSFTPNSMSQFWLGGSWNAWAFDRRFGLSVFSSTPSYMGATFNPYMGFRQFWVPGLTVQSNSFGTWCSTMGPFWGVSVPPIFGTTTFSMPLVATASDTMTVTLPLVGKVTAPSATFGVPAKAKNLSPGDLLAPSAYGNYVPPGYIMK